MGGELAGADVGGGGATGLGYLLAQQLVAAGEQVVDVQPKVAARVRLLASGNTSKNDTNDARSVAVAALRSPARRQVSAEDHTAVLKVWSKRYRDLGRARTQVACRRHAASGTTLTGIFGAGPVIAAATIGAAGGVSRFGDRDRFAACNGTAPIEVFSGERKIHRLSLRGNRRLNHAIHMAAVTQIRHKHSDGRAYFEKKIAEGKTRKEALRAQAPAQRRHLPRGCPGPSGLRILIGFSVERTGSSGREIPEVHP